MSTIKDIEPEDLNIESTPKVKDPKKVKAGKALAKKKAEARKNEEAKNSSQEELSSTNVDVSTIYNGILSMGALVGAGFTLYEGWKFFKRSDSLRSLQDKFIPSKSKVEEVEEVEEVKEVKEVKKTPLVSPSLRG